MSVNGKVYLVKTAHSYSRIPDIIESVYVVRNAKSAEHATMLVQEVNTLWATSEHVLDVTELYEWYMNLGDNLAWFGNVCLLQSEVVYKTPNVVDETTSEKLREY